jgi:hypothetical protein
LFDGGILPTTFLMDAWYFSNKPNDDLNFLRLMHARSSGFPAGPS